MNSKKRDAYFKRQFYGGRSIDLQAGMGDIPNIRGDAFESDSVLLAMYQEAYRAEISELLS